MLLAATIWTGLFVSALGATLIGGSLSPKPTLKNKPKSPATKVFYRGALAR